MDINEVNRQLDMCIKHFQTVMAQCEETASNHPDTNWRHFNKGKAGIASEAVEWIKEVKKNIAK